MCGSTKTIIDDEEYRDTWVMRGFLNGVFDYRSQKFMNGTGELYTTTPIFHSLRCRYIPASTREGKVDASVLDNAITVFERLAPEISLFVSHLVDTVYMGMYNRKGLWAAPDDNLLEYSAVNSNFFTECVESLFTKGRYNVIIKGDAFNLHTEFAKTEVLSL